MPFSAKLWFKLQRLKAAWRSTLGQEGQSYNTAHRMCSNCRALIDRGASVCPLCGTPTAPPRARASATPGRVLGVIPVPSTATSVLVAVNIALFGISWYMTQAAASAALQPVPPMGGISGDVLLRLGAKEAYDILRGGQWWRLVTAIFLHAGLLHIIFNLWCLFDLGPEVESLFSTTKFIVLYLVTGVAGFILSLVWDLVSGDRVSVGASGAILGLIGILIGVSFHHGRLGKDYRGPLWRWLLYILVFSFFFAVDNAAHVGGLVAGIGLGYVVPEGEPPTRTEENVWNLLAVFSVLIIAGSFALMALQLR